MIKSTSPDNILEPVPSARENTTRENWTYLHFASIFQPFTYFLGKMKLLCDIWNTPRTSFPSTLEPFADENTQFMELWNSPNRSGIVFAALDVHVWDRDHSKVTEIGLSTWCPDDDYNQIYCSHCKVEDHSNLVNRFVANDPDIFIFGNTRVVDASSIGPTLDEEFRAMARHFHRIILIGYGINSTIRLLRDHWAVPNTVLILDIQKLWQFQHRKLHQVTLEDALKTTPGVTYKKHLLNNAGNDTRYMLHLLQAFGTAAQKSRHQTGDDLGHPPFPVEDITVW
ncbi:hypothetical protein F4779DRAFT_33018 [Xylariaceae sp. FL0662B]|nr:hypothetical protein F4779DRAFT_33018 [Xylariaceae sp. FL0662B]